MTHWIVGGERRHGARRETGGRPWRVWSCGQFGEFSMTVWGTYGTEERANEVAAELRAGSHRHVEVRHRDDD